MKAQYKNAIQNEKNIFSAYLTLLMERGKRFTVTDIVKLSNINRGTFYLHFENIEAVGKAIEEDLAQNFKILEQSFRMSDIVASPEIIVNMFNEILIKDLPYYKLLANVATTQNLVEKIKLSVFKLISNNFTIMKYVMNYERFKIVVQYLVSGTLETYIDWLKGSIDYSIEELSKVVCQLIKGGLKGHLINAY